MTTLEREIIEKFRRLDKVAQQRVRDLIAAEHSHKNDVEGFNVEHWLEETRAIRMSSVKHHQNYPSATDLLNEARDERDNDILRGAGFGDIAGDSTN